VFKIINSLGEGAAMHLINVVGLVISNSKFINNHAFLNGGAIYAEYSAFQVYSVEIIMNQAELSGGGMYVIDTLISAKGSNLRSLNEGTFGLTKISLNQAAIGGGMRYFASKLFFKPPIIQQ
jgi:predicted outer membrane repeat protein